MDLRNFQRARSQTDPLAALDNLLKSAAQAPLDFSLSTAPWPLLATLQTAFSARVTTFEGIPMGSRRGTTRLETGKKLDAENPIGVLTLFLESVKTVANAFSKLICG